MIRWSVNFLAVLLVGIVLFLLWQRIGEPLLRRSASLSAGILPQAVLPAGDGSQAQLPPMKTPDSPLDGVFRLTEGRTIIPSRSRVDVITYTVTKGDNLFAIAETYHLQPETLLWGNFEVLKDNPHLLSPDQVLNILPVNGVYYKWKPGDNLGAVASAFGVSPETIINYPGNYLDLTRKDEANYGLEAGTWLIVPGGKRATKDWGPPSISRSNPATAQYYGSGSCGAISQGAVGSGSFVWPSSEHFISGYQYNPAIHPAIDIGGQLGNPVYAADSGVVVYSGWSIYGYGNLIVLDHGNGWQSAYAHLQSINVGCGQSVVRGGYIGGLGSTGNSSGPHLHFELSLNGAKVNPLNYLQ